MNIYRCLESLRRLKTPLYSTAEIARASGTTKARANTYIKRMRGKGLLYRVAKGFYSRENDPLAYASYLLPNSYLSFNTALYLQGRINQVPAIIQVAVPKRVRMEVEGVEFVSLPKKMFFGYAQKDYNGYAMWVAEPEKAVVDILYKYGKTVKEIEKGLDGRKIELYKRKAGLKRVDDG